MQKNIKSSHSIGEVSKQTGCKIETIHYYEKINIMHEPPRTDGGHRIYSLTDIKRLNFIRKCRNLGFSLDQVRELLRFIDEPDHYCGEVKAMAMVQYRAVQEKIDELKNLQEALNTMIVQCKGDSYTIDDCPIIDALFDESH
ncbi:MAG: helix-turn-helix domain-containing protein [Proteobacteria bacterium]|nr:helix-turn-helix domain-containing protein [Pseudomonadota bacterium]